METFGTSCIYSFTTLASYQNKNKSICRQVRADWKYLKGDNDHNLTSWWKIQEEINGPLAIQANGDDKLLFSQNPLRKLSLHRFTEHSAALDTEPVHVSTQSTLQTLFTDPKHGEKTPLGSTFHFSFFFFF